MELKKTQNGTTLTIALTGRLDANTAPMLEDEINNSLEGIELLVIDLGGVEYISSAGLRTIVYAEKTMDQQGSMELVNVSDELMEIFDVTGFAGVLTFK